MEINKRLYHQKALVTGANSGIGKAIALAFAKAGADVAINYIVNESEADEVAHEISQYNVKVITVKADVSHPQDVNNMFASVIKNFGTLDILVNNAGIQRDSAFLEMSFEDWQKVISVNLTGYFLCAQLAAREFIKKGVIPSISKASGKIICISSVHEVIPWASHCNYAASKGGVNMFMKSIAQELAQYKIRVNSIAPGAIKTNINKAAWATEEDKKNLCTLIPYQRIGETQDIGEVAAWLASDEADYIVGTTLFVDGGMCLYPAFRSGG